MHPSGFSTPCVWHPLRKCVISGQVSREFNKEESSFCSLSYARTSKHELYYAIHWIDIHFLVMSEESKSNQGSDVAKSLLKDCFQGARNLESVYTFSFASLVLSVLFVSKVFDFFMLNLLYVLNTSFFALVVRDSWLMRKKISSLWFQSL